jgi:hypothetical protein
MAPRTDPIASAATTLPGSSVPIRPPDAMVGHYIGQYRILDKLGAGAMGSVYRAEHQPSGRVVALKTFSLDEASRRQELEQISREAAAAAIQHPNVVGSYSFGQDTHHLYVAMELVAGGDSKRFVERSGKLSAEVIARLALQCARGLQAIHAAGYLHRDIKPSNILLDADGDAKLGDFGLVCRSQHDQGQVAVGTPSFMPPEQGQGGALDARSDLYALGATMFFWATGTPPFHGATPHETVRQVISAPVPDLAQLRPDLPTSLTAIIATAMEKNPQQRYQNAQAFIDDLRRFSGLADASTVSLAAAEVLAAAQIPPVNRAKRRLGMWTCAVAVLLFAALSPLLSMRGQEQQATTALTTAPSLDRMVVFPGGNFERVGGTTQRTATSPAHTAADSYLIRRDAAAINDMLSALPEFSIELVLEPDDLLQQGPARIASLSLNASSCNLMIGQSGSRIEVRMRTSATDPDGTRPHLVSAAGVLTGAAQHVIFQRSRQHNRLYVDGVLVADTLVTGNQSTWERDYPLLIGNEHRGGFPWRGKLFSMAISGPLADEDIAERARVQLGKAAGGVSE